MTLPQLFTYRQERRFLLPDVQAVRDLLTQRGDLNDYGIRTLYVDDPGGTWSTDPRQPRFRLRTYDGADTYWEQRVGGPQGLSKARQQRQDSKLPPGSVSLGQVSYMRTEWPADRRTKKSAVEVTIDRNVKSSGRKLPGFIVEVKQRVGDPLPDWLRMLLAYERPDFSKWRWVSG